jgi:hypothetical protein
LTGFCEHDKLPRIIFAGPFIPGGPIGRGLRKTAFQLWRGKQPQAGESAIPAYGCFGASHPGSPCLSGKQWVEIYDWRQFAPGWKKTICSPYGFELSAALKNDRVSLSLLRSAHISGAERVQVGSGYDLSRTGKRRARGSKDDEAICA